MSLPVGTHVLKDPEAVAREAAERIIVACGETRSERIALCLSGGSTPKVLYGLLAGRVQLAGDVDVDVDRRPEADVHDEVHVRETRTRPLPIPRGVDDTTSAIVAQHREECRTRGWKPEAESRRPSRGSV